MRTSQPAAASTAGATTCLARAVEHDHRDHYRPGGNMMTPATLAPFEREHPRHPAQSPAATPLRANEPRCPPTADPAACCGHCHGCRGPRRRDGDRRRHRVDHHSVARPDAVGDHATEPIRAETVAAVTRRAGAALESVNDTVLHTRETRTQPTPTGVVDRDLRHLVRSRGSRALTIEVHAGRPTRL